jgi:putative colanic acid biosysnthesis UDP-glucose lipid carrier transferase
MQIRSIESSFVWVHRILDIAVPVTALYLLTASYQVPWNDSYGVMGLIGGFALVFFNQATGVYNGWRGRSLFAGCKRVLQAWVLTWMFLVVLAFLLKSSEHFSRLTVSLWAVLTPIGLFGYRLIIRLILGQLRATGWNKKRIVIIGAGVLGKRIATTLNEAKMFGYTPTAFYDDDPEKLASKVNNIPVLGNIEALLSEPHLEALYDEVYITLPLRAEERIKQILNTLSDSSITVKFVPNFFSFDLLHSHITDIGGIPIVSVYESPLNSSGNAILKRTEDILLSIIIVILISPLLIGIWSAIKLTSNGPAIFRQRRYGMNGEEITILKFRTMTVSEDDLIVSQVKKNDARVTRLGAFLRRTSLDELPQFFNVIAGSMSIVGPRPHACIHNEQYRKLIPKYMLRHLVKPGITGWAQIHGWRGETDTLDKMEKRVEFDLHYIDNWSVWLDLKIILLTFIKGFINRNAY